MVRTIIYVSIYADYRESSKDTGFHSLFDTFANCRDVFLRNSTTNNCRFELVQFFSVGIHRLEFNFTVTILSTTTGLFCILAVYFNSLGDCLFISNLRSTYVSLYLEFTKETVNDDLQMKLTHSGDNCLSSFLVCMCTECRVFLCQFYKSLAKFALAGLCLRLDCKLNNRFRELHGFQDNRMLLITDGITCTCYFKSYCCSDIAGINFVKFLSLIRMHLKDTSYTLFLSFRGVKNIGTGIHCS